eukprot:Amastigsp_a346298_17.p3 type:complete len:157 gc:universal Amastigsp_a346298_17:484-954(+)
MPISMTSRSSCSVIGMTPFEPTPTGMWSKRDWVISSCIGRTSSIRRFVRKSRTPQLMSKPTPPGDTTASGSSISKAATPPIGNPYPECTSGIAMAHPTMPGSCETLAICFMAGRKPPTPLASLYCATSSNMRCLSSSLTKNLPGTRMSGTKPGAIS